MNKRIALIAGFGILLAAPASATMEQDGFLLLTGAIDQSGEMQVVETRARAETFDPFGKPPSSQPLEVTKSIAKVRDCVFQLDARTTQDGKVIASKTSLIDFKVMASIRQDTDHMTQAPRDSFTFSAKDRSGQIECITADVEKKRVGTCAPSFSADLKNAVSYPEAQKAFARMKEICGRS